MREHDDSTGLSRRQILGIGGSLGVIAAAGLSTAAALGNRSLATGAELVSAIPLPAPFHVPLPIPPVLRPVDVTGGVDRYEITQREVRAEILPGITSRLWTYDGSFPGPTIESRRSRPVSIVHRNQLPVPTVVHLHGGHTPPESDGYPTNLVHSTERREYTYPLNQRPTMLWYHDHRMDFTAPAIWRGLAGMHIIRDGAEGNLGLPVGSRELPLMITDRAFAANGDFAYPALDPDVRNPPGVEARYAAGVLGDVILVNGAPWPVHEVDAARYRLRMLNASNARHYRLEAVDDNGRRLDLVQVGADQGLLSSPVVHRSIPIAPAERYDVIIDFATVAVGTRVRLVNRLGAGRTKDVMAFHIVRRASDNSRIPQILSTDLPTWRRQDADAVRSFAFRAGQMGAGRGWLIGGLPFNPDRPDVTTSLGNVEIWRLIADVYHPVHLHLVGFRILSRNGRRPLPTDAGLKDTIALRPGEAAEIITRFDGWRGRYLFHCHNAEHEDMGMMANLEIA